MHTQARDLINKLNLKPHPEGGWYRETWRHDAADGGRGAATAIYFLLAEGERSHWHRVRDADEIWLWHAGAPLDLELPDRTIRLGPDVLGGEQPQARVPADVWQAAQSRGPWTLVSCVVAPAFEFASFELAAPGWSPSTEA